MYEVYEMYGIHLAEAEQTLDLVRPSLNDAKLLGIDAGTPVMLFQSLTYDTGWKGNRIQSQLCAW